MKKIMLSLVVVTCMLFSCDSDKNLADSEVPEAARAAFATRYPGATDVKWKTEKKDGVTIYEAEFKKDGKEIEAEFNADGSFITEEE